MLVLIELTVYSHHFTNVSFSNNSVILSATSLFLFAFMQQKTSTFSIKILDYVNAMPLILKI